MTISNNCAELVAQFEGFRSSAYQDGAGIWTIGYGTTHVNGKPVTPEMTCTQEQAKEWLRLGMKDSEHAVLSLCKSTLTQNQLDSLVCLVYNIGSGNFSGSTILRKINDPKLGPSAVTQDNFTAWNKIRVDGKLIASVGLTRRRKAEYQLFSK